MKVSIITVCKNAQDTIEETIKSIINQSYSDIELVIIDGDSSDNTKEILEQCSEKIAYCLSESDTGVYNAMNKGIKAAKGDILYFLNANDYLFDENVIADVVAAFKSSKADILWGGLANLGTNGEIQICKENYIDKLFFLNGENMCHQCIFYKSELFNKYGFYDESFKIAADYDFNLKVLIKNKVKYTVFERIIAKFSLGGFSTSEKYRDILLKERDIVINRYFSNYEIKLNKVLRKSFRSLLKNKFAKSILCYFFRLNM